MHLLETTVELSPWVILGFILLGIVLGVVTTIGGIGGGPLIMPIFLLILEYEINIAKGTSIFLVFLGASIAAFKHYKNKKVHLLSMFMISLVGSMGSVVCFLVEPYLNIDTHLFSLLFGIFELYIAARMLFNGYKAFRAQKIEDKFDNCPVNEELVEGRKSEIHRNFRKNYEEGHNTNINIFICPKTVWKALPLFFVAGYLATFLGIGGGPVYTPVLYEIVKFPIYNATAGSTTIIFFNSIVNLIMYGMRGEIDWAVGIIMGAGMMVGAFIGAKYASNVPRWATLGLLTILLVFAGVRMITN